MNMEKFTERSRGFVQAAQTLVSRGLDPIDAGVVSVTQPGSAAVTQVGTLQLATFINEGGLDRVLELLN